MLKEWLMNLSGVQWCGFWCR